MRSKRLGLTLICAVLICVFAFNSVGCSTATVTGYAATDLMYGIRTAEPAEVSLDQRFTDAQIDFAVRLFKEAYSENTVKNTCISPISVMVALAMTANGADGETLAQLEAVLGGGMGIEELNKYLGEHLNRITGRKNSETVIANSIWFKETEGLSVKKEFLRDARIYYDTGAYSAPFDDTTLNDINKWVSDNTDGMIPEILKSINPNEVLILMNTVLLQTRWESPYDQDDVIDGRFSSLYGVEKQVNMLCSLERGYIETDMAVGFKKRMGDYNFVAVLPNSDVSIEEYIALLDADELKRILGSDEIRRVHAKLPMFQYEYTTDFSNVLCNMGVINVFDARLSELTRMADFKEGLYVDSVMHKTKIELDRLGLSAAAATAVAMRPGRAAPGSEKPKDVYVTLDRPFIYIIVDQQNELPVFIGTVTDIGE